MDSKRKLFFEKNIKKVKNIIGLSFSLAKVNFKLRNEGSYLGIFWYLLNPLAMFCILLILGNVINKTTIQYYPVYLLLGIVMFNIFSQSTNGATNAISRNAGFIKSMKINYEPFVLSGVLQTLFSHCFELVLIIGLLIYFKISLIGLVFYPIILLVFFSFIVGFSFILATIGAYVSDLANAWSVIVNLTWFMAPVYYVVSKGNIPIINKVNPMFYFITIARDVIIYNRVPEASIILISVLFSGAFLLIGILIFEKFKNKFAETV